MAAIRFIPEEKAVTVTDGTNLLEAARKAGVFIAAPCEGSGTCGKCRVKIPAAHRQSFQEAPHEWLTEAERAGRTLAVEVARVPEAILLCREGRFAQVVQRYSERRRAIEATLAGDDLRTMRLLRALAISKMPSASSEERDRALELARPGAPGECDHLAVAWPELGAFLQDHGWRGRGGG